jgi:MFS family permease
MSTVPGPRHSPRPRPAAGFFGLPANVWALAIASFLRDVASEMLVHLLPLFLANVLAVGTTVIGLIEGIGETTASVVKIYSGWLSDRLGRRKGLTASGYALAAAAVPILHAASSAWVVGLARFLDRFGKGIRTAPRDALIADSIGPQRRGVSFGFHRAADSGGAFVGLLVAIALVWHLQRADVGLDESTFRTVVAWATVPAVLAVVAVLVGVREATRPRPSAPPQLSLAGTGRAFRRYLVVMVIFTLGNSSDAFLVLRAQSVGASVLMVLAMIACFNLVYALAATPAGALSDRLDRRRLIIGGWWLYALVYLGFAAAGWIGPWLSALAGRSNAAPPGSPSAAVATVLAPIGYLWLLYALYGVYYAMTEGVAKALVADLVPQDRRGTAYGAYNAAIGVTALPASVLAGLLWQGLGPFNGFGPAAPFLAGGVLALLAGALLWHWVA